MTSERDASPPSVSTHHGVSGKDIRAAGERLGDRPESLQFSSDEIRARRPSSSPAIAAWLLPSRDLRERGAGQEHPLAGGAVRKNGGRRSARRQDGLAVACRLRASNELDSRRARSREGHEGRKLAFRRKYPGGVSRPPLLDPSCPSSLRVLFSNSIRFACALHPARACCRSIRLV